MFTETLAYNDRDLILKGYIAYDDKVTFRRPAVLVVHAWRGQDGFAKEKAIQLAALGYVGFAVDMYGNAKTVSDEDAPTLMEPLFLSRKMLQERIIAAFDFLKKHRLVDSGKIGVIGFCFGGLCAIELLRSGVELSGAVSFHAVFGNKRGDMQANTVPISQNIRGSLLILQGQEDPFITFEDIHLLQQELTDAKVDWQMHIFGSTAHGFTNPEANNPKGGVQFNLKSSTRAWKLMVDFFEEVF